MKSSLTNETYIAHSGNYQKGRGGNKVEKITIHQMAGRLTGKQCAVNIFGRKGRKASANYCIGYNGDIVCNVDESDRAFTSSSKWNDERAITIEVSNDRNGSSKITTASYNSLINLCADICRRYNFKLNYTGNRYGSLTRHDFYSQTDCPGSYIKSKIPDIVNQVNARLNAQFRVGQKVLVNIPVAFTGAMEGDKMLVESNGYLFWIHKSVVKNNNQVYGLGTIIGYNNGIYRIQIFDKENKCEFDCKPEYMTDKF